MENILEQDLQELLKTVTKNFSTAEQQYFENDNNTDPVLAKIRKANYDTAANTLNLVEQMAGLKPTQKKTKPSQSKPQAAPAKAKPQAKPIKVKVEPQNKPKEEITEQKPDLKLNFPDYEEIQASKDDQPAPKISTSAILREAARQSFVGKSNSKSRKNGKGDQHEPKMMTREQYRKLHNKK